MIVKITWLLAAVCAFLVAGCGGGGRASALGAGAGAASTTTTSLVTLQSGPNDYVGDGKSYSYTKTNAVINVNASGRLLTIGIGGDESWSGTFHLPASFTQLQPGTYAARRGASEGSFAGLDWSGGGRGCNTLTGSITIKSVSYVSGSLSAIDLSFEQYCDGSATPLRGTVRWFANDPTIPPGPVNPPPADLWQPPAGATPSSGNYMYVASDAGDYIGSDSGIAATYLYRQSDAWSPLRITQSGNYLTVNSFGDRGFNGYFMINTTLGEFKPGYYAQLQGSPHHNPLKGSINWSSTGRGCNLASGWLVIDSATYVGGVLTAIDMRFEQHCEKGVPALRAKIHWRADDTTVRPIPGPLPVPAGLWQPYPGATPPSGNYLYLQSGAGDFIGEGGSYVYTQADSAFWMTHSPGEVRIRTFGDEDWTVQFFSREALAQMRPGFYYSLEENGNVKAGAESRGCSTTDGWFVIDSITYSGGVLTAIDVRFEQQRCDWNVGPLRGKLHWRADDTTSPPGPVNPPPSDLWQPPADATPATGNYVYLQSETGDFVGQGQSYLHTDPTLRIDTAEGLAKVLVDRDGAWRGDFLWTGRFKTMDILTRLQPGYYGQLQGYPFHNLAKGGLDWDGMGRGCNKATGWFVVDGVTYTAGEITALDLRFEQRCTSGTLISAPLHGKIHWRK